MICGITVLPVSKQETPRYKMEVFAHGKYILYSDNLNFNTDGFFDLQVSRMSILACLGGEAEAIRDMYLTRLQAVTEVDIDRNINLNRYLVKKKQKKHG